MNIGYISEGYPEVRNIIKKNEKINYIYDKKYNNKFFYKHKIDNLLAKVKLSKYSINNCFKHNQIFKNNQIDLYHYFNHIGMSSNFVTTFESTVPRIDEVLSITREYKFLNNNIDDKTRKIINREMLKVADDKCKKLIAISECTRDIQLHLLNYCDKEVKDKVKEKIVVVHPPQEIYINDYEEKKSYITDEIVFMFVGNNFHGKGGYEITKAFDNISKKYDNIKLILVGDLEKNLDYVKSITESEVNEIKSIINNNKKIEYYKYLENDTVIELMKKSNVGLLPTWADTYGYSVLEFQACGCPVITSNARALPEINNNNVGWMIEMPLTKLKEIDYIKKNNINYIRNKFIKELEIIFIECIQNNEVIEEKSKLSIQRIKEFHNVNKYGDIINEIYENSI